MVSTAKVSEGAVDAHTHVFDHRFPWASTASFHPGEHHLREYRSVQRRLGSTRQVLVQPSSYGTDNSLLLEALAEVGAAARGIAVVTPDVEEGALRAMDDAGVRGVRVNLAQAGATTPAMVVPLAHRVAHLGWHLQVHAPCALLPDLAEAWDDLPCPVVLDHLARVPDPSGDGVRALERVRELLGRGSAWVKLSAPYVDAPGPRRDFGAHADLVRQLLAANPEQVVWGSDWPHVTESAPVDDEGLLRSLLALLPDDAAVRRVLVDNPRRLYGFDPEEVGGEG